MNRKGHVGTVLLVIGALILVILALFIMVSSNGDLSLIKAELWQSSDFAEANHDYVLKSFEDIVNKSIVESKESPDFEVSFNDSLKRYASEKRTSGLNNNLYAKLSLGQYSLIFNGGAYELFVQNITENYNLNNNEVVYSYSLNVAFDKNKVLSIDKVYK